MASSSKTPDKDFLPPDNKKLKHDPDSLTFDTIYPPSSSTERPLLAESNVVTETGDEYTLDAYSDDTDLDDAFKYDETVLGPFHNEHYSDDEYTHDAYYDDEYTHDAHSDNTDVNDQYTYDAYSDNTDSDDSDFDHGFAYDEYPYYDSSQHEAYNSPSSSKQKLLLREKKLLGAGSFGHVYRVYDSKSSQVLAVKKIDLGLVESSEYKKNIAKAMTEVEAMEKLKHERIVQYIRHEEIADDRDPEKTVLNIYMEYMTGGTISKRLDSSGAFTEMETKRCMKQILEGLSYLHGLNILHRDVKGSNILFDENDNIKLSDFGVSKQLSNFSTYSSTTARTNTGLVGTANWMAPEVIASEKYGVKADIWSSGATMVEMLTKNPLWPTLKGPQLMYKIVQKEQPPYDLDPSVSSEAREILDAVLIYDQDRRPTAKQLLNHTWFGPPLPKSIELLYDVAVSPYCRSVHTYRGITYAGCDEGVDRIDKNNKVTKSFISIKGGNVLSISVHNDQIYTLSSDSTVRVHDLKGKTIISWTHTDKRHRLNQLAIINNQIAIPDRQNKTLVFYSLNGEVVNTLPCPLFTDTDVCLSAADNNSVIISQCDSSLVSKVDTLSGAIIWQSMEVAEPRGVICYRDEFVLVVEHGTTICVLSLHTGELLSRISAEGRGIILDIHINGSTLVLLRYLNQKLEFYQLK